MKHNQSLSRKSSNIRNKIHRFTSYFALLACLFTGSIAQAEVLAEAEVVIKMPLAQKPSTRPMMVAYVPKFSRYYLADGGLAPAPNEINLIMSNSKVHVFDATGHYLSSFKPGYDNRTIYFNPNTNALEVITYNVSSDAGFGPNLGIFNLLLDDKGDLTNESKDIFGFNPAFGDAATMPSYNDKLNVYYAKQEHSHVVNVVDLKQRQPISTITLDTKAADAPDDEIHEHFIAYTGVQGQELALLNIDQKNVLLFDLTGKFVGKSKLPETLRLRSQNHLNGAGYSNGLMFVYNEPEGEFGTYYGFRVVK